MTATTMWSQRLQVLVGGRPATMPMSNRESSSPLLAELLVAKAEQTDGSACSPAASAPTTPRPRLAPDCRKKTATGKYVSDSVAGWLSTSHISIHTGGLRTMYMKDTQLFLTAAYSSREPQGCPTSFPPPFVFAFESFKRC